MIHSIDLSVMDAKDVNLRNIVISIIISTIAGVFFYNFFGKNRNDTLLWEFITIGFFAMIFLNSFIWLYIYSKEKDAERRSSILTALLFSSLFLFFLIFAIFYVPFSPSFQYRWFKGVYLNAQTIGILIPFIAFILWHLTKRKNNN